MRGPSFGRARRSLAGVVALGLAAAAVVATTAGAAAAGADPAASPTWSKAHPAKSPTPRDSAAMAYDGATHQLLLFGGESSNGRTFGQTWLWHAGGWEQLSPATKPQADADPAMAYDAATRQLLLVEPPLNSGSRLVTWTWTGGTWSRLSIPKAPASTFPTAMAYDGATNELVLTTANPTLVGTVQSSTWTWKGGAWTRHPAATTPGYEAQAVAFDAVTRQLLMFGGLDLRLATSGGGAGPTPFSKKTFAWTGATWKELKPSTSPSARMGSDMVFDPATRQLLLFGGISLPSLLSPGVPAMSDTWQWTGTTWQKLSLGAHPTGRGLATAAYAPGSERVVLFGGLSAGARDLGDSWLFGG